jgi:membrane-associated protein
VHRITDWLSGLSGTSVYAVVGALVFCEDALFLGFVLPGESAVLLAGALAAQGHASVVWVAVTVVLAAIAGDSVGYEVGRRFGPAILATRPLRAHQDRIADARDLVRRRGAVAVFLGRFVSFFRALMPAIAGMSDLRYRTFLLFNALGGLVWGVAYTALGYSAGAAYGRVAGVAGRVGAVVLAVVAVIALAVWRHRRGRTAAKRDAGAAAPAEGDPDSPGGPGGPDDPGADGSDGSDARERDPGSA